MPLRIKSVYTFPGTFAANCGAPGTKVGSELANSRAETTNLSLQIAQSSHRSNRQQTPQNQLKRAAGKLTAKLGDEETCRSSQRTTLEVPFHCNNAFRVTNNHFVQKGMDKRNKSWHRKSIWYTSQSKYIGTNIFTLYKPTLDTEGNRRQLRKLMILLFCCDGAGETKTVLDEIFSKCTFKEGVLQRFRFS